VPDHLVHEPDRVGDALAPLLGAVGEARERLEVDLDRGEELSHLVVQLARDAPLLLFLGVLELPAERTQPSVRSVERLLARTRLEQAFSRSRCSAISLRLRRCSDRVRAKTKDVTAATSARPPPRRNHHVIQNGGVTRMRSGRSSRSTRRARCRPRTLIV
jgi:hypothetical protein